MLKGLCPEEFFGKFSEFSLKLEYILYQTLEPFPSFALLILGLVFLENCTMLHENVSLLYRAMFTSRLANKCFEFRIGDSSYVTSQKNQTCCAWVNIVTRRVGDREVNYP